MSLRLSLVLVVICAAAAITVAWYVRNAPGEAREVLSPFFYTLDDRNITNVSIVAGDSAVSWHVRHEEDRNRWYFDDPKDIPVDTDRWGGITVLLGGPRTQRVLRQEFSDPAMYGLDDPQTIIQLTLRDGTKATLHIGDETPDGEGHYARRTGMPQLQLVDSSWGRVLARLATEPPFPGWYYEKSLAPEIEEIHQALFFHGLEPVRAFGYNDTDDPEKEEGWYLCDLPLHEREPCTGPTALDTDRVQAMLMPILEPRINAVEAFGIGETFLELAPLFDSYGLGEDAPYVTLRRETVAETGVTEVWAISLSLGNLTPDGSEMYAVAMDSKDVLRVDAPRTRPTPPPMTNHRSRAEIITVGHELLMGEIVDTNTSYIALRLAEAGFTVAWASQIGDELNHLAEAFERAFRRSHVTVVAGGLGPTSDDLTREAMAGVMGEEMHVDPALLQWLKGVFSRRGLDMPDTNIKQATLIPSAEAIPNPAGTAPGWWVHRNDRHAVLLPGPPREISRMWAGHVGPRLTGLSGAATATTTLKTAGITEGGIDEMVAPLLGRQNPYLGIYSKPDGIHLRIIARAQDPGAARALIAPVEERLRSILGNAVWGTDGDTPASRVGALLAADGATLGVIDGATGGAISSALAVAPEHERFYRGALVIDTGGAPLLAPALEAMMGSQQARLRGGLGPEAAVQMATAARALLDADIGLGITAPAPADAAHPEGTVFIGMVSDHGSTTATGRFRQAPEVAMQRTALLALIELASALAAGTV